MSPAGEIKLGDIAEQMPIDPIEAGDTVSVPRDRSNLRLVEVAIQRAGEAFIRIFGKTVTVVDGRKILIRRKSVRDEWESGLKTLQHLIRHNEGPFKNDPNLSKVGTVPMMQKTLENAHARLRDEENGTLAYARRVGQNEWHLVFVRPDGSLEDHGVTASFATQFSVDRKAGQFDLPVDREEYLPALWRVNTPPVQSREPCAGSLTVENSKEGQDDVNPESPMSPAGDAMKIIAKHTGSETKTTFNGGTYTAGGALSPDGKLDKQAGDKWRETSGGNRARRSQPPPVASTRFRRASLGDISFHFGIGHFQ